MPGLYKVQREPIWHCWFGNSNLQEPISLSELYSIVPSEMFCTCLGYLCFSGLLFTLRNLIAGYLYTVNASTLSKQWNKVSLSFLVFVNVCMFLRVDINLIVSIFFLEKLFIQLYAMQMGPFLEKTVASFRLLPPTDNYVPPYKDPWRFWWSCFF